MTNNIVRHRRTQWHWLSRQPDGTVLCCSTLWTWGSPHWSRSARCDWSLAWLRARWWTCVLAGTS